MPRIYAPSYRVRIPQVADIKTALRLFYERTEIGNAEINAIFGGHLSSARISKLKKLVILRMQENNIPRYDDHKVNTESAYEVWGIDIKRLERGIERLNKLNIMTKEVKTDEEAEYHGGNKK